MTKGGGGGWRDFVAKIQRLDVDVIALQEVLSKPQGVETLTDRAPSLCEMSRVCCGVCAGKAHVRQ